MTNFKKALANKGFVVGGCIFLAIALIALVGPLVWTVNPNAQEMTLRLSAPSPAHPFGCDDLPRPACPRHRGRARVAWRRYCRHACDECARFGDRRLCVLQRETRSYSHAHLRWPYVHSGRAAGHRAHGDDGGERVERHHRALHRLYAQHGAHRALARDGGQGGALCTRALRVQGASIACIVWLHIVPNVMAPFLVQATFVFAEAVLSKAAFRFWRASKRPTPAGETSCRRART